MRVAYLATADARGHLMRAQLLAKALRRSGASVDVVTTSDAGVRFLAGFGIGATLLSPHYAVQFDSHQNMLRAATDANVAAYVFRPSRMLRDIWHLRTVLRDHDVVIDDSFHPALIVMGGLPFWRRKVVHVYGTSLRQALQNNFQGRLAGGLATLFGKLVGRMIDRSRACLAHDFVDDAAGLGGAARCLPTPVAVADVAAARVDVDAGRQRSIAVYLNPHFRDPALAEALEQGLAQAGWQLHLVGEGFVGRAGWLAHDSHWVERAAESDLVVSAPGLAALSIAAVYQRPILLLTTDQPEQRHNLARAAEVGLAHRSVAWRGDGAAFTIAVRAAVNALCEPGRARPGVAAGSARADARLQTWVAAIAAVAADARIEAPVENRRSASHLHP